MLVPLTLWREGASGRTLLSGSRVCTETLHTSSQPWKDAQDSVSRSHSQAELILAFWLSFSETGFEKTPGDVYWHATQHLRGPRSQSCHP